MKIRTFTLLFMTLFAAVLTAQKPNGIATERPEAVIVEATTIPVLDGEIEDAWEVTRQVMLMLKQAVEEDGATFAIVLVPPAWDIDPTWQTKLYETLEKEWEEVPELDFEQPYRDFERQFEGTRCGSEQDGFFYHPSSR